MDFPKEWNPTAQPFGEKGWLIDWIPWFGQLNQAVVFAFILYDDSRVSVDVDRSEVKEKNRAPDV